MLRALRFRLGAALVALGLASWSAPVFAGAIDFRCSGMPPTIMEELESRIVTTMSRSGVRWSTIAIECDGSGVWLVWFDGSRALVDQTSGLVPGTLALVEGRIAFDRGFAANPGVLRPGPDGPPRPDLEVPPADRVVPDATKSDRKKGTEGGIGAGLSSAFWGTSATGIGPRLDVAVGPAGPIAFLLAESALFGTGAASSSQITAFDFQAGVAFGSPYKVRSGFGGVVLVGAERIAAANARSDGNGLWEWMATFDVGARGSFKLNAVNLWLGLDLLIRTSDFEVGGSTPVSIPTTSFMLSAGGFLPAFKSGSAAD
jgi:hypothetical protein